jgi:hypothetical protein
MNYSCNYHKNSVPKLEEIHDYKDASKSRTRVYKSYKDITSGNIQYYTENRPISQIYSTPVFTNDSVILAQMYKDPMNSHKSQYSRVQTKNNLQNQLSFIQDTCEAREELIALQMRKMNENVYQSTWNIT